MKMIAIATALGLCMALASGTSGLQTASERQSLPEGYGLAAHYPGDRGIANDPKVLFAEDFATGAIEQVAQRWTDMGNKDGKVMAFAEDSPLGSATRRALQVTATLGQDNGGYLYKRLPQGQETLFARFYVKFASDAEYIHHFVALGGYNPPTNYPQGGAGERPRGDDRLYVGIEPHGDYGHAPPPGYWSFYNYWSEMKVSADGKYWGNAIYPENPPLVPKNRWQCVEVMVKLNSAPDKADGELALWLDGKRMLQVRKGTPRAQWSGMGFAVPKQGGEPFEGFRWRTSADLKLNYFWLMHYVTENVATYNHLTHQKPINRVWFDNVVISTAYIGPIKADTSDNSRR